MAKRTPVTRLSREDRDQHLRAQCVNVALSITQGRTVNADDIVRGAEKVYRWMTSGELPAEPTLEATEGGVVPMNRLLRP